MALINTAIPVGFSITYVYVCGQGNVWWLCVYNLKKRYPDKSSFTFITVYVFKSPKTTSLYFLLIFGTDTPNVV